LDISATIATPLIQWLQFMISSMPSGRLLG